MVSAKQKANWARFAAMSRANAKRMGTGKSNKSSGSKGRSAPRKHSVAFEGALIYDAAKVVAGDVGGMSLGRRALAGISDPAQRAVVIAELTRPGTTTRNRLRNETKETQFVVGERLFEAIPGVGKVARKIRGKINTAARPYTGKKYDLI